MGQNPGVATVKRDYYEVLGLSREADEETIRRAFHALARDCHPDVTDAPDAEPRFRELAEAYGVLSKREARLLYDRYGYRGMGNQGFDEMRWEERERTNRGENVHLNLELLSFEAAEGSRRVVSYEAAVRCQACAGRGSLHLADPDCELCGGTGRRRQALQLYFSDLLQIQECPECVARPCASCGGSGTVVGERRIRLRVPPGVQDCAQLRVGGEGNDAGAGSIPGDLLVHVRVLEPPRDPRIVRYAALVLLLIAAATLVLYVLH
jgi:molecular chaperone DnaJ